jgi:hypothetical protein
MAVLLLHSLPPFLDGYFRLLVGDAGFRFVLVPTLRLLLWQADTSPSKELFGFFR